MKNDIQSITRYLFDCDFSDDGFDPEEHEEHQWAAQNLQKNHLWKDIIKAWQEYLYTQCQTADEVINFANLFFYYDGPNNFIPEPYKFIGYLYAKVNMDEYWDEAGDLFDSIAIDILGYQQLINLEDEPCYNPLKDTLIQKEIKKWHQHK